MSTRAIVRAATAGALTNPYVRAGANLYRYGPTMARAAMKIAKFGYRRYRRSRKRRYKSKARAAKRQRFSRKNIGETPGLSNAKRSLQQNSNASNFSSRTLNVKNLCQIPFGDDTDERQRHLINMRGFKLCFMVRNRTDRPVYWHWALISSKINLNNTPSTDNFFRGSGNQRGVDFANDLTSLEFHCLPINTDIYNILKHKKYRINSYGRTTSADATTWQEHSGRNYMDVKAWIPLKRQLRFDNNTSDSPISGSVFLVHWCDQISTSGGVAPVSTVLSIQQRHIAYFRETDLGWK